MIENLEIGESTAADLTAVPAGMRVRLNLPYERPPKELGGNARAHWRAEAKAKQQLRADVAMIARSAGLHRYEPGAIRHVTAQLLWAPGDRRKRDEDNLWKVQKIACDALARGRRDFVGLDLVPDDSPNHFTKLAPRILPPPEPKGMWLELLLEFRVPA